MHVDALGAFMRISLQRKIISNLEREIGDLNSALDSLMEEHASLVSEQFNVSDTLAKKVLKIDFDTCPILNLENENLKGVPKVSEQFNVSDTLASLIRICT